MDSALWWTVRAPEHSDNIGAESFDLDESKQKTESDKETSKLCPEKKNIKAKIHEYKKNLWI